MAGPRAEKVAAVEEVKDHLERNDAAILTEYRGLKVGDLATLRRSLRAVGAEYRIYKNTLVRRATAETGRGVIDSLLEGPTAIAFVQGDVAAVAKVLRDFARTNPALVVKGGVIGESLLDARSASALAELPSREVLLAQLAGMLAAPMQRFAGLLKALPQNLAYGISAVIDQKRAAGDTTGEASGVGEVTPSEAADTQETAAGAPPNPSPPSADAPAEEAPTAEAPEAEAPEAAEAPAAEGPAAEVSAAEGPEAEAPEAEAPEAETEESAAQEADTAGAEATETSGEESS